jgi:hypothetical protein
MTELKLEHKGKPLYDFHVARNTFGPGWIVHGTINTGYVTMAGHPGLPRRRFAGWNGEVLPGWRTVRDACEAFHAATGVVPATPRQRAAGLGTPPVLERTGDVEKSWGDLSDEAREAVAALVADPSRPREAVVWCDLPPHIVARTGHPPKRGVLGSEPIKVAPEVCDEIRAFARWNAWAFDWLEDNEQVVGLRAKPGVDFAAAPAPGASLGR